MSGYETLALQSLSDASPLIEKHQDRISALDSLNLTSQEKATTAILLDNAETVFKNYATAKGLSDSTYAENVGPYRSQMLNLITLAYNTWDFKDVISIQPLKQRISAIYILNAYYNTDKGQIKKGDIAVSPGKAGVRSGYYSSEVINKEPVAEGTRNDTANTYTAKLKYYPIYSNKDILLVVVGGGDAAGEWKKGTTLGTITNGTATGTINFATGEFVLNSATADVTSITATYRWESEQNRELTPQFRVGVEEHLATGERRALMVDVSLDATIDYNSQFRRDLVTEQQSLVLKEMQNQLAYYILEEMKEGSFKDVVFEWDSTRPSGISLNDHYQSLFKLLAEMSSQLYTNSGRGRGNKILAGTDFIEICESLPDNLFVPVPNSENSHGPHKVGRLLNKFDVYLAPNYNNNEFYMTYKGSKWWEAPYFLGSYLPLMPTKFLMFPDMHGEQGYISIESHDLLFPNNIIKGTIA